MLYYNDLDVIDFETVREELRAEAAPNILAVGDLSGWQRSGRALPRSADIALADFHEVTPELLSVIQPTFIVSPAICRQFDCLDLSAVLSAAGYTGIYRALMGNIPNPEIIRREVKAMCPGLDFDFIDPIVLSQLRAV